MDNYMYTFDDFLDNNGVLDPFVVEMEDVLYFQYRAMYSDTPPDSKEPQSPVYT